MRPIKGKYGDFFGCKNYPKCDFTSKTRHVISKVFDNKDTILPGDFNTRKG